jgi:hypothetical protein
MGSGRASGRRAQAMALKTLASGDQITNADRTDQALVPPSTSALTSTRRWSAGPGMTTPGRRGGREADAAEIGGVADQQHRAPAGLGGRLAGGLDQGLAQAVLRSSASTASGPRKATGSPPTSPATAARCRSPGRHAGPRTSSRPACGCPRAGARTTWRTGRGRRRGRPAPRRRGRARGRSIRMDRGQGRRGDGGRRHGRLTIRITKGDIAPDRDAAETAASGALDADSGPRGAGSSQASHGGAFLPLEGAK